MTSVSNNIYIKQLYILSAISIENSDTFSNDNLLCTCGLLNLSTISLKVLCNRGFMILKGRCVTLPF